MHAKSLSGRKRAALSAAAAPAGREAWLQGLAALVVAVALLAACQPTVKVEAPKDPITINLNIQADVRVTLEEKAKEDIASHPDVF